MPRKSKTAREDIIAAGLSLIREGGVQLLNARDLASRLGTSTQPIFSNFESMDQVREAVIGGAKTIYGEYLAQDMSAELYPPYKASGMSYIRFAREEPELFKLLFMRDRRAENVNDSSDIDGILNIITENLGIDRERALLFHLAVWSHVHGIAAMLVTGYLDLDTSVISSMLSDVYHGLKAIYTEGKK